MSIGLVYGRITGLLRKIVIPNSDADLSSHVNAGEALIVVSRDQYAAMTGPDGIQAYVNSVTGTVPSGYRAAMVDEVGNAVSIHFADPGCDYPHSGHRLIWNSAVQKDWLLIGSRLIPSIPLRNRKLRSGSRLTRSLRQ